MPEDPELDETRIAACLLANYGLEAAAITFLPLGYDAAAAVYRVVSADGAVWFCKVRFGALREPVLQVPRALLDIGIRNVLAPVPTRSSALWCALDDAAVVLHPFIDGDNAMEHGLTNAQWREFGATLRAIHDSGLAERFRDALPRETFSLPSAAAARQMLAEAANGHGESVAAARLAAFLRERSGQIDSIIARAEGLGVRLRAKPFVYVLCHADIHAANILVNDGGQIHLIDWDNPLIAPRERDLLFVVGSRIARDVLPREEALFFTGYGPVTIDTDALIYYRYERMIEDIGEFAKSVFLGDDLSEATRAEEAALLIGYFAPGGYLASVETVTLHQ